MKFNYQTEKNKLDRAWVKLEEEYRNAGMTEEAIEEMRAYDYEVFRKERTYCNHTNLIDFAAVDAPVDGQEDANVIVNAHMEAFSVGMSELFQQDRYGWIESIEDEKILAEVKKLKVEDLELLTLLVFDGYSVSEIARIQGVSPANISKKTKRIKKLFEKFSKQG